MYYLQSRYYNPKTGRFLNADAFTATGQGILGNNMFMYCLNNPANYIDYSGARCVAADIGLGGGSTEHSIVEMILGAMTDPRKDGRTVSVGVSASGNWGGATGGVSGCISADNSYNYALQKTDTVGATGSFGVGASLGFCMSFTNANNVQDLSGASQAKGFTLCNGIGVSVDLISFVPTSNPSMTKYGICITVCIGAEFELHAAESYTTSTASWNPIRNLKEQLYGR